MVGNDSILQIYLDLNLEEEASDSGRRNDDSLGPNVFGQIIEIPNTSTGKSFEIDFFSYFLKMNSSADSR